MIATIITLFVCSYITTFLLYCLQPKLKVKEGKWYALLPILALIPILNVVMYFFRAREYTSTDSNTSDKLLELINTLLNDDKFVIDGDTLTYRPMDVKLLIDHKVCYFEGRTYRLDNRTMKQVKKYIDKHSNIDVKLEIYRSTQCSKGCKN